MSARFSLHWPVRLAALLAGLLALGLAPAARADDAVSIRSIDFVAGQKGALPGPDTVWQSHTLPMRWTSSSGARQGLWLRLGFDAPAPPPEGWGLLLQRLPTGGTLYLNGHMVAELPADSETQRVRWRRPHLINLPNEFMREGRNEALLHTSYGSGVHGVGTIEVGPATSLQPLYGREFFVSHTLRWISLLLTILLAVGFAALWLRRHSESLFGLLSLIAAFWVLSSLDSTFEVLSESGYAMSRWTFYLGTAAFTALATITMWRQSGRARARAEVGLCVLAAMGPLLYLISGDGFDLTVGPLWLGIMLGALALGVLSLARRAFAEPAVLPRFIVATLVVALAAAIHDYLAGIGVLAYASPMLLNVATPLLVFALGATLIDRFVRSLAEVEKTNSELESRIHEREQLLKRNFDRLRDSERIKASAQERQRIMQDMHDGLGSQLLSSLMLVERGAMTNEQVAQILRESIDDMRLAIDALAADDSDLLSALGNMRFRMEPRLRAAGMELQWDARNLPEEVDIDSNAVLPVLRITQEALTNAIKHSRARVVRVTLGVDRDGDSQWLSVRVTDNGRGLAATGNTAGRGMQNMKSRASRIAAFLKVESVPGAGTMILLRLPLDPSPGPTTRAMQLSLDTEAVIEQLKQS
ncbi:MAG TPA: ATP-binding protein [Burkholderiaceae bacterium]|nr:ATP-binding protein [Burkholderiaceae bacterium]